MSVQSLAPLLPDAQAALEAFFETLLGDGLSLQLDEPAETTFEAVMPEAIGYLLLLGAAGPRQGFAVLAEPEIVPLLSKAMLGEPMTMDDEGADDLVKELLAQGYGSVRNQLGGAGVMLPEVTYQVIPAGNMLPDDNLPDELIKIPFTFEHGDTSLRGTALMPIPAEAPPAAAEAAPQAAASPEAPTAAPAAGSAAGAPAGAGPAVAPAAFPDLGQERLGGARGGTFDLLAEVELEVAVELGRRRMPLSDVLELTTGSVIELEKLVGESLEVYANGRLIAEGEAVVIDEQFGVRITSLASARQRAKAFL